MREIYGEGRDSDGAVSGWLAWNDDQAKHGVPGFWALSFESGEFVGLCGVLRQIVDATEEYEVGYLLRDRFRGHGYATEAAQFARDYAFGELGAARVISLVEPRNEPSARVALRNGMRLDRETDWKDRRMRVYLVEAPASRA